jgi:beta-phosphoglucomutase-like phosphatase (HAD superfamily)
MDGVLFDSMPCHAVAWQQAMTEFGLPFTENEAFLHEGRTGASTINIAMQRTHGRDATEDEIHRLYERKCVLFKAFPEPAPITGTLELVQQVRALGLTAQIVTGSGQGSLLDRIEVHYPVLFTPELMVTAFDVQYGKPHPEPYLIALQKAGITAAEAVVIENAPLGVQSAKAAGIFTIAVNTGPLPMEVFHEADVAFPSMPALAAAWPELYATFI